MMQHGHFTLLHLYEDTIQSVQTDAWQYSMRSRGVGVRCTSIRNTSVGPE